MLIGDAAVSPPPPGAGINHALEAAGHLNDLVMGPDGLLAQGHSVGHSVSAYSDARMRDEEAYAFLAAEKNPLQDLACTLGTLFGMFPARGAVKVSRHTQVNILNGNGLSEPSTQSIYAPLT